MKEDQFDQGTKCFEGVFFFVVFFFLGGGCEIEKQIPLQISDKQFRVLKHYNLLESSQISRRVLT